MNQQRGGTLVGFIIGVLVGLGAALAVAVYVTKVPIPFLNKGQSRTAEQDVAEAKKNKDWDPNAPLYGKNPARPASAAASAPAAAASAAPAASSPAPSASRAGGADPLGDLAKSRAGDTSSEPFAYFVQLGAFRTLEDAESQRAKLSLAGIETKVTEREQSGRAVFRVRVGPFDRREDAERAKEKLDAAGMDTALVRVQR
jgi:cell division protein FtsN